MKKMALIFSAAMLLTGIGCGSKTSELSPSKETVVRPQEFGNGVYYFPCPTGLFGKSIAYFIENNPNLRVVTVASTNHGGHGVARGYFVICERKEK